MTLPCRNCAGTKGSLPITAFTTARNYDEIWRVCISKGQLLTCFKCTRALGFTKQASDAIIYCDGCCRMKQKKDFDKHMYAKWQDVTAEDDILCKECSGSTDKAQNDEVLHYAYITFHIVRLNVRSFYSVA